MLWPATALAAPGDVKWKFKSTKYLNSPPTLAEDGTIYFGGWDGQFYAFNPDGTKKWETDIGGNVYSGATLGADGTIYIGGMYSPNGFYALNPDGTVKWVYPGIYPGYDAQTIAPDGTIYVGDYSGEKALYALNPDGTLKWKFTDPTGNVCGASVAPDGTIYAVSYDDKLYAVTPDGKKKWSFPTNGDVLSIPAIAKDGTIFFGSKDNKFYALNPDGAKRWEYETGDDITSSPVIASDGTVYIGSYDMKLYAFTQSGALKWTYETGGAIKLTSPAIGSDGTIYVASADKYLYALNPDGTLKWRFLAGTGFDHSSPAIGKDGTIYIGNDDYYLYAIEGGTNGYWPTFLADMQRTGQQFFSEGAASPTQASGVTASVTKSKAVQNTAAGLCACSKGLAGFMPVSKTIAFNATVAPAEANATFLMTTDALNGTVAEFWLYKVKGDGSSLPFLFYTRSANFSNGAWWIADASGKVLNRTAPLAKGTLYTVYFVIKDNGQFDLNASQGFIRDPVVLGRSCVSPGPDQPAGALVTVPNAARREVLPGDMAVYEGWTDFQASTRFAAFNATVCPNNATGVFRFNSTALSGPVEDLQLLKLFPDNFTAYAYGDYAPSVANFTDGSWWLTWRNNTHIPLNATLILGTNYFINFAVRDNGPFDADPTPGAIADPAVLGTTPSFAGSAGCMLNPVAGFAPELFILLITPFLALLRKTK